MNQPKFLIAKYVPDIIRMEPRNIGVVVWSPNEVYAKFIGEDANGTGKVHPPKSLVGDAGGRHAYSQWITYWRMQLRKNEIRVRGKRKPISRGSPDFIDAIASKSKEQFMLVQAGDYPVSLAPAEVRVFANELFEKLVQTKSTADDHEEKSIKFKNVCNQLFKASGLKDHPEFRYSTAREVPCVVGKDFLFFQFNHAIVEGPEDHEKTRAVFQRVFLDDQKSLASAGWMFEHVSKSDRKHKIRCGALVNARKDDEQDRDTRIKVAMLRSAGASVVHANDDVGTAVDQMKSVVMAG